MSVIKLIISGGLVLLFLAGCTSSKPFFGNWIAHRAVIYTPGENRGVLTTASELSLSITPDGFTMIDAGIPKTGYLEYSKGIAYLHVTEMLGQPMSRQDAETQRRNVPIRLTPQPDGTMILYDPESFDTNGLVLKRVTSPQK